MRRMIAVLADVFLQFDDLAADTPEIRFQLPNARFQPLDLSLADFDFTPQNQNVSLCTQRQPFRFVLVLFCLGLVGGRPVDSFYVSSTVFSRA